jgi:hypothetical protein
MAELVAGASADLVNRLEDEGLIEVAPAGLWVERRDADDPSQVGWRTTIKGNALAKARIGRPMTREKAQHLRDGLLRRVVEVNEDEARLFWINRVGLFGSFANPAIPEVGDVDVLVFASPRFADDEQFRRERAFSRASGRSFSNLVEELSFPQMELCRFLKARSPRIDIQLDLVHGSRLPENVQPVTVFER